MLDELRKIIAGRVGTLDVSTLRQRFGDTPSLRTPAEMFDVAQALCLLARDRLDGPAASTVAQHGADLLLRFIAEMPEPLAHSVRTVPAFVPSAGRAWDEPTINPFVALACTVQDVWAHLLGPESAEDDAIVSALIWHEPRTALDFGCGAGHFAHVLALAGVEVDCCEIDPLKTAFLTYRALNSGLAERIRLGQHRASYDMVLAINVLDHMEDPVSALDAFRNMVGAGRVLCTLAAFPHDGWHQSDVAIVAGCAESLWRDYTLSDFPHALPPWMDCWIRSTSQANAASEYHKPRLNPGSTFHDEPPDRVVLHANRFYSSPLTLDPETADVCRRFDGNTSLDELAAELDLELSELQDLCAVMQNAGHVYYGASCDYDEVARHVDPRHSSFESANTAM